MCFCSHLFSPPNLLKYLAITSQINNYRVVRDKIGNWGLDSISSGFLCLIQSVSSSEWDSSSHSNSLRAYSTHLIFIRCWLLWTQIDPHRDRSLSNPPNHLHKSSHGRRSIPFGSNHNSSPFSSSALIAIAPRDRSIENSSSDHHHRNKCIINIHTIFRRDLCFHRCCCWTGWYVGE